MNLFSSFFSMNDLYHIFYEKNRYWKVICFSVVFALVHISAVVLIINLQIKCGY